MLRLRWFMFTSPRPLVLGMVLGLFGCATSAAAIVNGSFQDSLASAYLGQPIPGWSISGAVDWTAIADSTTAYPIESTTDTEFPATQAAGTRAFRNGSNGDWPTDANGDPVYEADWAQIVSLNYTYLYQQVATTPGNNYLLTFQLQALFQDQPYYGFWVVIDQNPVRNLSARTETEPLGWTGTANQWVTFQIPFLAAGASTEIGFASILLCNMAGCDIDLYLDDVVLTDLGADANVPEPSAALLIGLSLPVAYWLRRRGR